MIHTILAIESSCDDTSAAVLRDGIILSNCIAGQEAHRQYGGVIPELASRAHSSNIIPVVDLALKKAGISIRDVTAIAFTRGPGLLGSLLVGVSFAKALALSLNVPLIEVDHMSAHVLAQFAEDPKPKFPFLCLTASGGHTQITRVDSFLELHIIGRTLDDASGEAFDKAGKMMGLDYPAGPIIDKLAKEGKPIFQFASPAIKGLDFSFSGLKTSILYFLQAKMKENPQFIQENLPDLCASVQDAIVRALMNKLVRAAKETGIKEVAIAGGVSANSGLRNALLEAGKKHGWNTYIPAFQYCTDNAGMIAVAAYPKLLAGIFADQSVAPYPRQFQG